LADVVDELTRSRMMAGIKGKNTKPELAVRRALHALGFRYRIHARNVPGRPDLTLPKFRAAIFVHGCFWHGHDCSLFRLPATRSEFWLDKIDRNRARDAHVAAELSGAGWRRLSIWECAFRGRGSLGLPETITQTVRWLNSDEPAQEIRGRF
jgi:DNA mismatch endonuclease (patch repair protein)